MGKYLNPGNDGFRESIRSKIYVDRLVMLLTDSATIRDVLLFPTMKPKK